MGDFAAKRAAAGPVVFCSGKTNLPSFWSFSLPPSRPRVRHRTNRQDRRDYPRRWRSVFLLQHVLLELRLQTRQLRVHRLELRFVGARRALLRRARNPCSSARATIRFGVEAKFVAVVVERLNAGEKRAVQIEWRPDVRKVSAPSSVSIFCIAAFVFAPVRFEKMWSTRARVRPDRPARRSCYRKSVYPCSRRWLQSPSIPPPCPACKPARNARP